MLSLIIILSINGSHPCISVNDVITVIIGFCSVITMVSTIISGFYCVITDDISVINYLHCVSQMTAVLILLSLYYH